MNTLELAPTILQAPDPVPEAPASLSWFDESMLALGSTTVYGGVCGSFEEHIDMHPHTAFTLQTEESGPKQPTETTTQPTPLKSPNRRRSTRLTGIALSLAGLALATGCSYDECGNRCSLAPGIRGDYPDLLGDSDVPPQLFPPDVPFSEEVDKIPPDDPNATARGFRVDRDWYKTLQDAPEPDPLDPATLTVRQCTNDWYRPYNPRINANPFGAAPVQKSPLLFQVDARCIGNQDGYTYLYEEPNLEQPTLKLETGEVVGAQCAVEWGEELKDATKLDRSETRVWYGVAVLDRDSPGGRKFGFIRWAAGAYTPLFHIPSCT